MRDDLELNAKGNIVMRPLTGWDVFSAAGIALVLVLEYQPGLGEAQTGDESLRAQIALTPQQALELAEKLQKAGKSLLQSPQTGKPYQ